MSTLFQSWIKGGGISWSSYWTTLLAKFDNTVSTEGVSITARDSTSNTNTHYYLQQRLYQNKCMSYEIEFLKPSAVGDDGKLISQKLIEDILKKFDTTTSPAVVLGGAGWTNNADVAVDIRNQIIGGRWAYNNAGNCSIQLTTPDNCTEIFLSQSTTLTVGCAAIVEIDGDRTLANLLPTAQELVDAGTLANTILVANGGAFNPTDRVLEYYTKRTLSVIPIANGLTAASHVFKITRTAHKHASSGDTYIYYRSVMCGMTDTLLTDAGLYFNINTYIWKYDPLGYPVDEFAYAITPTGATGAEWIGHTGSLKIAVPPVFKVDGAVITPAHRSVNVGDEVIIEHSYSTYHSEIDGGATSIGTIAVKLILNKVTGLTIEHNYILAVGGIVTGYPAMMTTLDILDKCTYAEAAVNYNLLLDNGAKNGLHDKKSFYVWDSDGYLAQLIYISDLANVDNWLNANDKFYYLDNNAQDWNKAYIQRFNRTAFNNADEWFSSVNYRTQWFPSGADAELAK